MAALVLLLSCAAAPALAHPFGPPPTARIWADDSRVVIDWTAAPDDTAAIGVEVGVLSEQAVDAFLEESPAMVAPPAADLATLDSSEELRTYLLEHIQVLQGGRRCDAELAPVNDFIHRGATVVHSCPRPVVDVEVVITMLHSRHEAYRTFAFSRDRTEPDQAVFTVASPSHTWVFGEGDAAPAGRGWVRWAGLGLLGSLLIGGVVAAEVASGRREPGGDPDAA